MRFTDKSKIDILQHLLTNYKQELCHIQTITYVHKNRDVQTGLYEETLIICKSNPKTKLRLQFSASSFGSLELACFDIK